MSGPHADQPVKLPPHEVERLLILYRAHPRTIDGRCGCGLDGCDVGFVSRGQLWAGGINPDWPPR
jgi:hypothetical protein